MNKEQRITGRRVAMTFIYQALLLKEDYEQLVSNIVFDEGFMNLEESTRQFIKKLCKETLDHSQTIELYIEPQLKEGWKMSRLSYIEQSILLLGGYEIMFTDIPKAILIDEYTTLARKFCDAKSFRFINAVLDKIELTYE